MVRRLVALFSTGAILSCSGPTGPIPQTPLQAAETMRAFATEGKWDGYWNCLSPRGKGWFIAESASTLAWDAGAQPIDPKAGESSRLIIEKYGLTKQNLQRKEGETSDAQCLRIGAFLGSRGSEYCKELSKMGKFTLLPGPGQIRVLEEKGDHAVLEFSLEIKIRCNLSKIDGRWLLDGPSESE